MTEPVKGISGTQGASAGGSYSGGRFSGDKRKKEAASPQPDLVEISQDARERLTGKKKKNILEYLKDLFE